MMRRYLSLYLVPLMLGLAGCRAPATALTPAEQTVRAADSGTITGDVRRHAAFASKYLTDKRDLWVYLPPGYESHPRDRYPVLYMHDGNNLFDANTAFLGNEWHMDETAERMIRSGELPPLIIVGVSNTPARLDEYTWKPGAMQGKPMGGKGSLYARMLVDEVKPFIDKTYRTKSDRANTGVMGSSLGGLISLYLAKHEGATFGKIGAMSPSIWWSDRAVLADMKGLRTDDRLWLDMGTQEGDTPEDEVEGARMLDQELLGFGYVSGRSLQYMEDEGAGHNESAWARRAPMALRFLFGSTTTR
ncbi:MAG TPA: alpha/beta hydrolase-fold protein [Stenomitos sp.]